MKHLKHLLVVALAAFALALAPLAAPTMAAAMPTGQSGQMSTSGQAGHLMTVANAGNMLATAHIRKNKPSSVFKKPGSKETKINRRSHHGFGIGFFGAVKWAAVTTIVIVIMLIGLILLIRRPRR